MEIVTELREWVMLLMEAGILYFVAKEFYYDKEKDDKRSKKTRTTKKTTTQPCNTYCFASVSGLQWQNFGVYLEIFIMQLMNSKKQ